MGYKVTQVDHNRILRFIQRYELNEYLLEWAGIFRILGHSNKEFSFDEWTGYMNHSIHPDILQSLFRLLEGEGLIRQIDGDKYIIDNEIDLQRTFELIHRILSLLPDKFDKDVKLLWTLPDGLYLPKSIVENFEHLDLWIQQLIQRTNERLIFFAPYYSEAGIEHILISINTLMSLKKNVKIDFVFGHLQNEDNERAIGYINRNFTEVKNVGIYFPQLNYEKELIIHAKVLLSDNQYGYMGSANFSKGAFISQFELGVKLTKYQVVSLVRLVDHWIKSKFLIGYNEY